MKILIVLSLISLISFSELKAQLANLEFNGVPIKEQPYDNIKGTPYLNDGNWGVGNVIDINGKKSELLTLRYNVYEDAIEYRTKDGIFIFKNEDILECLIKMIGSLSGESEINHFKRGVIIPGKVNNRGFVEIEYEGVNFQMLTKHYSNRKRVPSPTYGGLYEEKFVNYQLTWFIRPGITEEIDKINTNTFIKMYPGLKKSINQFVRDNKTILSEGNDLYEFLQFLDEQVSAQLVE